ncbi:MAG TPA: GNAT family N-acetyltransferase [Solirubrobacteraceae bacterium]|jgi:ribosomal protein S18 acetylase RimI-like enzyme|nr:GNAT family N-acetyltransferase [Solirubrobacteraceae bacterium]
MDRKALSSQHAESLEQASADALSPVVRVAQLHESGPLAAALGAAFFDDPIFGWLIGDRPRRQARLQQYFALQLAHSFADGRVWTTDGLQGAALCMPPGQWRLPPKLIAAHSARFTSIFRGRLPRAVGLLVAIERRHLRGAHYYFANIGVAPEAQGQGLGSRLMRPTLDRCDTEGLPAYLEASSERNAALYERLGFQCTEILRFAGSPPLRLMTRPPQPLPRAT